MTSDGLSDDGFTSGPQDHIPVDDLIDSSMSDEEILLAARLDETNARRLTQPPPPRSAQGRVARPSSQGRTVYRDPNTVLGGVASGLAYHTGIDVRLMRLLFVLAILFVSPMAFIGYVCACMLIPKAPPGSALAERPNTRNMTSRQVAVLVAGFGAALLLFGTDGAAWSLIIPTAFIGLGVWLFLRGRRSEAEADMPYPFADDGDLLATTPEYEHYITNRARRFEEQRVRRNRGIAIASAIAGLLVIGAVAGVFASSSTDDVTAVTSKPIGGPSAVQVDYSDYTLRPATTSSLDRNYDLDYADFVLDLTNTVFDSNEVVTINAQFSDVKLVLPSDGTNIGIASNLEFGDLNETGERAAVDTTGNTLSIEVDGEYTDVEIEWIES